jgi:hypothetical protein
LKNWVLEGPNNSGRWVELDRRENNDVLNDGSTQGTFAVQTSVPVQWIRLRQIGPNHWNGIAARGGFPNLLLSEFEIFGTLVEPNNPD